MKIKQKQNGGVEFIFSVCSTVVIPMVMAADKMVSDDDGRVFCSSELYMVYE